VTVAKKMLLNWKRRIYYDSWSFTCCI